MADVWLLSDVQLRVSTRLVNLLWLPHFVSVVAVHLTNGPDHPSVCLRKGQHFVNTVVLKKIKIFFKK